MYKVALLALLCAFSSFSQGALASPMEGGGVMLMARRNMMVGGGTWKNPYITDGLVAMWDGEWNAGWGVHDANATVWKDLIGEADFELQSGVEIGDKSVSRTTEGEWTNRLDKDFSNVLTLEIIINTCVYKNSCILSLFRDGRVYSKGIYSFLNLQNELWMSDGESVQLERGVNQVAAIFNDSAKGVMQYYKFGERAEFSTRDYWSMNRFVKIGSGYGTNDLQNQYLGEIFCIRAYSRRLTEEEILANYKVDKVRFNLV